MRTSGWITLFLLLVIHMGALAQPGGQAPDSKAAASEHFRRGVALFQEDAFRAALVEFERAHEIAPDYRLLYNIGQCKLRLQDYLGAVQSYEAYLAAGGASIPRDRRSQVEEALISLRERVGRVAVACNRADAEVFIDDASVGKTPLPATLPVNVGRHRILVRAADGSSDSRMVSVAGGDVAEVAFELRTAAPATPLVSTNHAEQPWTAKRKAAVASWSGGVLLLAAAGVTGALTLGTQTDLDRMLKTQGAKPDSVEDKRDSLKTLALSTDVLIATGAAALLVGTILWLVDRRDRGKDAVPALGAGTAERQLRLRLAASTALLGGTF